MSALACLSTSRAEELDGSNASSAPSRTALEQAEALSALGTALAQAGQEEQASQVWTEAERVIGTITDSSQQAEALSALGTALAQAGQWAEAERVIGTIGT